MTILSCSNSILTLFRLHHDWVIIPTLSFLYKSQLFPLILITTKKNMYVLMMISLIILTLWFPFHTHFNGKILRTTRKSLLLFSWFSYKINPTFIFQSISLPDYIIIYLWIVCHYELLGSCGYLSLTMRRSAGSAPSAIKSSNAVFHTSFGIGTLAWSTKCQPVVVLSSMW